MATDTQTRPDRATRHTASCHCGDVRFAVVVDPSTGTRCNCTICTKLNPLGAIVKPDAFELLVSEDQLASYSRFPEIAQRYFCKRCHVMCFSRGHLAELGGDFVGINLNTLDDFDPTTASVIYWDGRHDNWQAGPRATPWPI